MSVSNVIVKISAWDRPWAGNARGFAPNLNHDVVRRNVVEYVLDHKRWHSARKLFIKKTL